MKKNVWVFGLISGLIITAMMVTTTVMMRNDPDFEGSMVMGYATMLLAFSFIFVGIKNFRDKYNDGVISFGKAFRIGLYISLIAGTMYVGVWLIEYYFFFPDFMDVYSNHMVETARSKGTSEAELNKKIADINWMKSMYKNPLFVILITYSEVLPVGIIVSLICAAILKRKTKAPGAHFAR
jgi:hypothetical protein